MAASAKKKPAAPPAEKPAPLLTGPQRAAILVMYLERDASKRLLEHLSADELREIGLAMATVEHVTAEVITAVVQQFVKDLYSLSLVPKSGRDYALQILPTLVPEPVRRRVQSAIRRTVSDEFRRFIATRPPRTVAAILQEEHPQTQAIALMLMGPENAAKTLSLLGEQEQQDVALRMARLDSVPGEIADDIEDALTRALSDQGIDQWDVKPIDRTARILGRLEPELQNTLLSRVTEANQELGKTLRRRMFTFDDLVQLDARSIQAVLKNIGRDQLVVALRGAAEPLLAKFLSNLSTRAATDLREELSLAPPMPRSEIERVREEIVQTVQSLAQAGALRIPVGGEEML